MVILWENVEVTEGAVGENVGTTEGETVGNEYAGDVDG